VIRRRLGHTGPAATEQTPLNVVAVDCDDFNSSYDRLGHSYFLGDPEGRPGALLRHVVETVSTGRVAGTCPDGRRLLLTEARYPVAVPANSDVPAEIAS
jgi:hypothetical protein